VHRRLLPGDWVPVLFVDGRSVLFADAAAPGPAPLHSSTRGRLEPLAAQFASLTEFVELVLRAFDERVVRPGPQDPRAPSFDASALAGDLRRLALPVQSGSLASCARACVERSSSFRASMRVVASTVALSSSGNGAFASSRSTATQSAAAGSRSASVRHSGAYAGPAGAKGRCRPKIGSPAKTSLRRVPAPVDENQAPLAPTARERGAKFGDAHVVDWPSHAIGRASEREQLVRSTRFSLDLHRHWALAQRPQMLTQARRRRAATET